MDKKQHLHVDNLLRRNALDLDFKKRDNNRTLYIE